jgi:carbohydrate diacid regulator
LKERECRRLMIISSELAQKIVDQLMDIVQRNVNIMDCSGTIIASGQSLRINTFHQGGKLAVDRQNVVEIYPEEVQHYRGALPGVMWPIRLKEKIIGVVGVTGEPKEVRNTANLVKTVTELILEREMFLADYRSNNWMKEQFVNLLFSDKVDMVMDDIHTMAEMLNYKLNLPRTVILIKIEPNSSESFEDNGLKNLISARIREIVSKVIQQPKIVAPDDLALFYKKKLCFVRTLSGNFGESETNDFAARLIEQLKLIQGGLEIKIGIGSQVNQDRQLFHSYHEALFALEFPGSNLIRAINEYDVLVGFLFDKQFAKQSSCLALRELKRKFVEIKGQYDMEKTLECLLANNLNLSLTASRLYIHRNTLKFRLERLKKMTGLEPSHNFQHAMLCKFLLTIDEKTDKLLVKF